MSTHFIAITALLSCLALESEAAEYLVRVKSADPVSSNVLVKVPLPGGPGPWSLVDSTDKEIKSQLAGPHLLFAAPPLTAGSAKEFTLKEKAPTSSPPDSALAAKVEGENVELRLNNKPVLNFNGPKTKFPRSDIKEIYQRGGYIHPVWTPSGIQVTDDFPTNHVHHHGIWFTWTKTDYQGRSPDFWNMGDGKGTVEFRGLDGSWSGSLCAGFRSRQKHIDLTSGKPIEVLSETWEVNLYPQGYFDLLSVQNIIGSDPLKLPEYRYGGVGYRGRGEWNGASNWNVLTAEGETDRIKGNTSHSKWVYLGGDLSGKKAGMLILDHKDNFRAPQPMRIHPDEPFFCYAPSQAGNFEIAPGKPYTSLYRFVPWDGAPDKAAFDQLWKDFNVSLTVTVTPK